jgi:antitoxin (DNA-binding transcriptional repressor) of toxin-antitoxin stability system
MKRTTIRELKHATSAVFRRVAAGETIEDSPERQREA